MWWHDGVGDLMSKGTRAANTKLSHVQKSDRALKHIQDLQALVKAGHKVRLLFPMSNSQSYGTTADHDL